MMKNLFTRACALFVILSISHVARSQSWDYINDPSTSPAGYNSDFAIHPITGEKYMAVTPSGSMEVWKFSSGQWLKVGGSISDYSAFYPSLEFAPDGTLYVAYPDGWDFEYRKPTVKKLDGENWVTVGQPQISVGRGGLVDMKISSSGIPYVVYTDVTFGNKVLVRYFNGAEWLHLGSASGIGENTSYTSPRLELDANDMPYIIYSSDGATRVWKWNGTSWVNLANVPVSMYSFSLVFDDNNNPIVIGSSGSNKASAYKFNGTAWTPLGTNGAGFSAGGAGMVAADIFGEKLYAAYTDATVSSKITVQKYNGTSWELVGSAGISAASHSWFIVLKMDADGNPFVNFSDEAKGHVMGFSCLPPEPINVTEASAMTVCPDGQATLEVTTLDGNTLKWYASAASEDVLGNGDTYLTPAISLATDFYVSAHNECGSSERIAIPVTLRNVPVVSVTPPGATICKGDTVKLVASGATTYKWTGGPEVSEYSVIPTATTTYTVTGALSNGCTATSSATVTVKALPAIFVAGDFTICAGETTTLTAEGAATYLWSTGATGSSVDLTLFETTPLTVTGFGSNGCSNVAEEQVTVDPLPLITFKGDSTLCVGDSTTLTAEGAATYLWSTGARTTSIDLKPEESTIVKVRGVSSKGCSNLAELEVTVNPLPIISISGDSILCVGDSTMLSAEGGATYLWSNGQTSSSIVLPLSATSDFTVLGTTTEGCTSVAAIQVKVNPLPVITIEGDSLLCKGSATTISASGAPSLQWAHGPDSAQIVVNPEETSTFIVTGKSPDGCVTVSSFTVNVAVPATPEILLESDGLHATNIEGGTLVWYNCDTDENITGETSDTFLPEDSGNFAVILTTDVCVTRSDCFEVLVTDLAGFEQQNFTVSPNPSNGIIEIHNPAKGKYQIINHLGQIIWSSQDVRSVGKISLPQPGTYHVLFESPGHRIEARKIVVVK